MERYVTYIELVPLVAREGNRIELAVALAFAGAARDFLCGLLFLRLELAPKPRFLGQFVWDAAVVQIPTAAAAQAASVGIDPLGRRRRTTRPAGI